MGGAVWVCFFVGLAMGGHYVDLSQRSRFIVKLLQVPPMIANLGSARSTSFPGCSESVSPTIRYKLHA